MVGFDNRTGFTFGDVIIASYAMPNQQDLVQGPSVIISSKTYNQQRSEVLAMRIASLHRPDASTGEIAIQDISASGLDPGSALMPVLITLDQKRVRLVLGSLRERDLKSLRYLLKLILGN